jgi:hypothetical protein
LNQRPVVTGRRYKNQTDPLPKLTMSTPCK